jgi:hypothetical protein
MAKSSNPTSIEQDGLGDWRFQAVTRLASDQPPAYPGGPSHKAAAPVYLISRTETADHPDFMFRTPNAAALALQSAFHAAERASALWPQIAFDEVQTPEGKGESVTLASMPILFDYFEECATTATASFRAIEAFANQTVGTHVHNPITLPRRKRPEIFQLSIIRRFPFIKFLENKTSETLNSDEIEKRISTEEKISVIIPDIIQKSTPKGRREWQHFVELRDVRNAAIHFKSADQYLTPGKTTTESLYYYLLNHDPRIYPRTALAIIWALRVETDVPRWLLHLAEKYGTATREGKAANRRTRRQRLSRRPGA